MEIRVELRGLSPSLESAFTALFKYPPRVFQRGDVVLAPVLPALLIALAAIAAGALVIAAYSRVRAVSRTDRMVLGALRIVTIFVILGCLLRPTVVLSSAVPQRNVLALLLDDSRSMRIRDVNQFSRLEAEQAAFADTSALVRRLAQRFAVRIFRFASEAAPIANAGALSATGTQTEVAGSLDAVRENLAGMPLAGIVLVSDGADNGSGDLGTALLALRARRLPVYTVGIGAEQFARDVAVQRVVMPHRVLAGSAIRIDATLAVRGAQGDSTSLVVEANGRIVATQSVRVPARGAVVETHVRVPPLAAGAYHVAIRVKPLRGETVVENNDYHTMLDVHEGPARILYVEGEPRPEFAFLRRAAAGDSGIQMVGLMRSADRKYLRLGVRDSLELIGGFPTTREELFQYRAIVLGSVEASFFTGEQLRMLADFVGERGGSLLALGGRSSMGEGGYADTPVSEVLPVIPARVGRDTSAAPIAIAVHPTAAGLAFAALQLRSTDDANAARWDSLPPLTSVNEPAPLRPGATVLLAGRLGGRAGIGVDVPVLSFQHYGRGIGAVFAAQDSWLWKMDASVAADDETYATLWRQLLRWMAESAPDRVSVTASASQVSPGEAVTVRAHVVDSIFRSINGATVIAQVTRPDGVTLDVPLEGSLREDGTYSGRYVAQVSGAHSIRVGLVRARDTTRSAVTTLLADAEGADMRDAEMRAPLLRRIARETGGRYYPLDQAQRLADDVVFTESGVTVRDVRDLWDMPIVFLLLAALLGAEWTYRRRRGLA